MTTPNSQMSASFSTPPPDSLPYDGERFKGKKASAKDLQMIAEWAKSEFEKCKSARAGQERQWKLNLAFFYGRQNVIFRQPPNFMPGQSGQLYTPPAPWYRSRPTINRIRPIIRKEMSRLTSQKPTASVVPASTEDVDMYAARAGEQIWDSLYREHSLKAEIRNTLFWTLTCGDGYLKTFWDQGKVDSASNQQGDFCYDSETPFHVLVPDLRQTKLEGQPYLIHATIKPVERVQMRNPALKLNRDVGKNGRDELLEDSYINLTGSGNVDDKKTVLVMEFWVKPDMVPFLPGGAMFTMVGDTIVDGVEGWPYAHGKFPFAKFGNIPSGKFYCDSVITDLIPLQREYNRTRGQIIEAKNQMAKPQLLAPAGSVDPRKITSEPGLVIEYQQGYEKPMPLPLVNLPPYVIQELDRILMDMSDIAGIHDVSQGAVPPGVTAATAISYLQEQDESMGATTFDSMEEAIEKTAQMSLSLVGQFWTTPRMVKVTGLDGSFEVMAFKGAQLNNNTDIRVEGGSALPTSKAAKQAFIMDLMKMQFIDPKEGLEVMEIGGINKIYDRIQVDIREAQRENIKMSRVSSEQIDQFTQLQLELEMSQAIQGQVDTGMPQGDPSAMMGGPVGGAPAANGFGGPPGGVPQDPSGAPVAPPAGMAPNGGGPNGAAPGMPGGLAPGEANPLNPQDGGVQGVTPMGAPRIPLIVPVQDWNEHRVHIEVHNKFRKSQAFDSMPEHVRQLFDAHVKQHVDEIIMGQLAQVPPQVTDQMGQQGIDPATMGAVQEAQQNEQMAQQESQAPPDQGGGPGAP